MMFKYMSFLKRFLIILVSGTLCAAITNAASTSATATATAIESLDPFFEVDRSVTIKDLPEAPPQKRAEIITTILSDPKASLFDLSISNIGDKDIEAVFDGLIKREIRSEKEFKNNHRQIKLLDISQEQVTKKGIENLLGLLQNGATLPAEEGKGDKKGDKKKEIFPDVRGTIMKVSSVVDFTEELLTQWQYVAPSVFSGGLRIID